MAHALRTARILALAALAMPGALAAQDRATYNRSVSSSHQPVVSRTDYSLDIGVGRAGLSPGEPQRLAQWFDSLALGYGDTVTVDDPAGWRDGGGTQGVGRVLSRYGMLLADEPAPASVGHPAPGSVRVVVSRATARVPGCPNWSRGNLAEYEGANTSNFGCATAVNLAAMIADPQDLVEGERAGPASDAINTVKAIAAYRDAAATGKGGLKSESSKGGN